jgi:dipeptidyl aminopeptidase/acylaminoacyl peptidase
MDSPKYAAFNVSNTPYKVFNGQKIYAVLFIPKNIPPGKYPLIVKFHGGYFVCLFQISMNTS